MVVKTDGYSEFGAHMYILSAQIYISRKFKKKIQKRHTLRSVQHVLSYLNIILHCLCAGICVCVCV